MTDDEVIRFSKLSLEMMEKVTEALDDFAQAVILQDKRIADIEEQLDMPRAKKPTGTAAVSVTDAAKKEAKAAVTIPQDRIERIQAWRNAVPASAAAQELERQLRTVLTAELFDATVMEGTAYADIGWGYRLKVTKELNINGTRDIDKMMALINFVKALDPGLVDEFIKWVPEISTTGYRKVLALAAKYPDQMNPLLSDAITVKPGMPTLDMIAPPTAATEQPVSTEPPITVESFDPPAASAPSNVVEINIPTPVSSPQQFDWTQVQPAQIAEFETPAPLPPQPSQPKTWVP